MKFFMEIQNKLMVLGITPQQRYALNVQTISILLVFGLGIISTSFYVCNGGKSFDEYVACSYVCSVISVGFLGIANCIWNTIKLFRLLNCLENIINESEKCFKNLFWTLYFRFLCNISNLFQGSHIPHQKPFSWKPMKNYENGLEF